MGKGTLGLTNFFSQREISLAAGLLLAGILSFSYRLSCSANPESLGRISSSWTLCASNPQQHQKAVPWDPKIPLEVAVVLLSGVWELISEQGDLSLNCMGQRAILNSLISLFDREEEKAGDNLPVNWCNL